MHRYTEERPHPIISWGCILYYWVFFGRVMKHVLAPRYRPWYPLNLLVALILGLLFMLCEALNFKCHLITRALRRPGTNERGIPEGYGFGLVIMANYMWEGFGWTLFIPLAQTYGAVLFSLAAWIAMYYRGCEKYDKYMDHAPQYAIGKKILIPFIL